MFQLSGFYSEHLQGNSGPILPICDDGGQVALPSLLASFAADRLKGKARALRPNCRPK